jgi:hypothetical protein
VKYKNGWLFALGGIFMLLLLLGVFVDPDIAQGAYVELLGKLIEHLLDDILAILVWIFMSNQNNSNKS